MDGQFPMQEAVFAKRSVPGVKRIILVGSGKGGVGKSTVSANLALALSKLDSNVGLLDADIYGPSIPKIMGVEGGRLQVSDKNKIIPLKQYDISLVSMGFLLPSEDVPVIWRGPMLMKALTQMLFDVDWNNLDYLVIDLPPGTGDVQLTLAQTIKIDGAVVVTTPQDVALADVRKATAMFQKVEIPILGVIENMAYFICPDSGEKFYIFGKGKTAEFASAYNIKILGSIPLDPKVAELSDSGKPVVIENPESEVAKAFISIAKVIKEITEKED